MKTIICHHCDMVSKVPKLKAGYAAKCIRCGRVIAKNSLCDPSGILALCIAALILLIPAFYFPLISIHLLGITEGANLLQGALMMTSNAPIVSFVVLFCAVIAPTLLILTITFSSACLTFNYHPPYLPKILKITRILIHWSMLEVYMVSLMVAIFKLMTYADLYLGAGFYFFGALLMLNMTILSNYNNHDYWERYIHG
ncbi:paraquat-inducible protein A [Psychromonas ossibalaenae]|uniref:paraquat-inducible protein A n=1 Tax=Psychromonas ossibalaenae TaxID=444922 RepID=UPI0012FABDB7|nr:paraquat-inducible protein A [Psychromonas ossibalaenae]